MCVVVLQTHRVGACSSSSTPIKHDDDVYSLSTNLGPLEIERVLRSDDGYQTVGYERGSL